MRIWNKWKNKLWVQLGVSILAVNLLVILVSFAFQYRKVREVLLENAARNSVEWFRQSELNIGRFCEQANIALMELIMDSSVDQLAKVKEMAEADRMYYAGAVIKSFNTMRGRHSGIAAISYYGKDGFLIKSSEYINFVADDGEDWYYAAEIFRQGERKRGLRWTGGYTDQDLGLADSEEAEARFYISAGRNTMTGGGNLLLHYDVDYFLDIFYANEDMGSENIYIIDETDRVVAARNSSAIGTERKFSDGEIIEEGIQKYVIEGEEGKLQVIVYTLPVMGWKLVNEKPISEVTRDTRYMRNILLLSCAFCGLFSFALSMLWISRFLKPLYRLAGKMQRVREGELGTIVEKQPNNEIGVLVSDFNRMSVELKETFAQLQLMEQEKRDLEMQALRAQLNPHLIYNTLDAIKWMAIVNEERSIARSITLLSNFLEPIFRKQDPVCTVREELEYVRNYIAIMNLRSGEKYSLELAVPEEYYEYRIIRFLLQPVVENSILHGFEKSVYGSIRISMSAEGETGWIRVQDDGRGICPEKLADLKEKLEGKASGGERVGIANVHRRIQVYYGPGYGLDINAGEEQGTEVTLKIRIGKEKNQDSKKSPSNMVKMTAI